MNSWTTIQNELKELESSLLQQKIDHCYLVPDGYFQQFAQSVLDRIRATESLSAGEELASLSPFLASIPKKIPYGVPEGYFGNISADLEGITNGEGLPEVIAQVGKLMPYDVPSGYFENLPATLLDKVSAPPPASKVISFNVRKWVTYAAAAAIIGIISYSSIFFLGNRNTEPTVGSEEWIANKLQNVSSKELDEFINIADVSTASVGQKPSAGKTELRNLLKDVPNDELEKFLKEVPFGGEDPSAVN